MVRRTRTASFMLSVILAGAIAGLLYASRSSQTTSEAAANATPPPPGPTSAQVENRPLAESISIRGAITAPNTVDVVATASASEESRLILTGLRISQGDTVNAPSVLAEVGGRPIIVLQATTPFYRSIHYGDMGPDVAVLQRSLGVHDTSVFDEATQDALGGLYESLGYTPPEDAAGTPDGSAESSLESLLDAEEDANINGDFAVRSALLALDEAKAGAANGDGTAAQVEQAQLALDAAIQARNRAVSRAERDVAAERRRLDEAARVHGPFFQVTEFVAVPSASLTAVSVPVIPGSELEEGTLIAKLGGSQLGVTLYVSLAELQLLKEGMGATLTGVGLDAEMDASVAEIDSVAEGAGADVNMSQPVGSIATEDRPFRVRLEMERQPPATTVGMGILATISVERTDAAVIAVPVVALQQVGGHEVVVTLPDRRKWTVETGLVAEGWVELRRGSPPVGSTVETR